MVGRSWSRENIGGKRQGCFGSLIIDSRLEAEPKTTRLTPDAAIWAVLLLEPGDIPQDDSRNNWKACIPFTPRTRALLAMSFRRWQWMRFSPMEIGFADSQAFYFGSAARENTWEQGHVPRLRHFLGYSCSRGDDRRRLQMFLHSESVIEGEFIIQVFMDDALGRISIIMDSWPTQCLIYIGVDVVFVLYSNSSKQLNTPYCFFNVWGYTFGGGAKKSVILKYHCRFQKKISCSRIKNVRWIEANLEFFAFEYPVWSMAIVYLHSKFALKTNYFM